VALSFPCPAAETLLKEDEAVAANDIFGVRIPDGKIAREVTQLIRDTESDLLFYHSTRVYFWGALTGKRKGLMFDAELLYTAAMFHDLGLTQSYRGSQLRFEVDGANAAATFCKAMASLKEISRKFELPSLSTPGHSRIHASPVIPAAQARSIPNSSAAC
jgi:hypothetical protein